MHYLLRWGVRSGRCFTGGPTCLGFGAWGFRDVWQAVQFVAVFHVRIDKQFPIAVCLVGALVATVLMVVRAIGRGRQGLDAI
jgi:hypothetical protein